jgi:hypothetical protein
MNKTNKKSKSKHTSTSTTRATPAAAHHQVRALVNAELAQVAGGAPTHCTTLCILGGECSGCTCHCLAG